MTAPQAATSGAGYAATAVMTRGLRADNERAVLMAIPQGVPVVVYGQPRRARYSLAIATSRGRAKLGS